MTEIKIHSPSNFTEVLSDIEVNPLSPARWEKLVERVRAQNDKLSIQSLEIIILGLRRLENFLSQHHDEKNTALTKLSESIFTRLARDYNNPHFLKEVGLIYLHELNLPDVALKHFECSKRLGLPESEIRALSQAAVNAMQPQTPQEGGKFAKPVASSIITKTGSTLIRSRIRPNVAGPADSQASLEHTIDELLPETTQECLEEAAAAIQVGQFDQAELMLKKADQKPTEASLMCEKWTELGLASYEKGYFALVERAFVAAFKYKPREMPSHFNLGLGYHINDKLDLALTSYKKARDLDPTHPKILCNLGALYFQKSNYKEAESALRLALKHKPDYTRAWDNLAATLGAQNRLNDAMVACRQALEITPDYPEAHFKMGIIYFCLGELTQALSHFHRASALPATAAYCASFESMIHSRNRQMEAAELAIQRAIECDSHCTMLFMAWNDLAKAYSVVENYEEAARAYGEAAILNPDNPEAWMLLSLSYRLLGDKEAANKSYNQALDLDQLSKWSKARNESQHREQ